MPIGTIRHEHDAVGNRLTTVASGQATAYAYDEAALALQYLRARWYRPATGRFVSVDPAAQGVNWYAYVTNQPALAVDPAGLAKKCKVVFWIGDNEPREREGWWGHVVATIWDPIQHPTEMVALRAAVQRSAVMLVGYMDGL